MLCCKLKAADLLIMYSAFSVPCKLEPWDSLSRKNWDVTITAKMFPEGA